MMETLLFVTLLAGPVPPPEAVQNVWSMSRHVSGISRHFQQHSPTTTTAPILAQPRSRPVTNGLMVALPSDPISSLGRVGNPFEVPVGMSGEWQIIGFEPTYQLHAWNFDALLIQVPTLLRRCWAPRDWTPTDNPYGSQVLPSTGKARGNAQSRLRMVLPVRRVSNPALSAAADSSTQEEQGKPDYILRTGAVVLSALTVAEIEVTRAVLERGGQEQNPIYKPFADKPGVLGLVNGALTGGLGLVALELNRRGKKTEARVFVWAMVAVKAVVFTHNVRELRKTDK